MQINNAGLGLVVSESNNGYLTMSNITDVAGTETLTLTGDGTGTLELSGNNTYGYSGGGTTVLAGTLIVDTSSSLADGSSLTVGNFSAYLGTSVAAGRTAAPVPEPGTLALLLAAGLAAGLAVWRRRVR